MKIKITLLLVIISHLCYAQTERQAVIKTLTDYTEGSAYNQKTQLRNAFADNATLYLTVRGEFKRLTADEYVSWFKGEPGTFNGRKSKILSVNVSDDIATAKIEILLPQRNWRFIDLLLLRKNEADGHWKIISKTATREDSPKHGDHVLFVVSNAQFYGDSDLKTGNSFYEIVKAYDTFVKGGYHVDFVSPEGGAIPIAYVDTADEDCKRLLYDSDFMQAIKHTLSPSEVETTLYKAIQFIGGGSSMFGVPENEAIQIIAMDIYEKNEGIVSSVCHGTAGIVHLKTSDGKYLVAGKRVSGYPDEFERKDRDYYKTFPFKITETIENRGGVFKHAPRNTAHVEVDGRLVTGQNWLSSIPVAEAIIDILESK
ncbi:MAG: nuclear transport factor 2 family protein [Flavobacteriaceae bacterium]|nr:nuclear transport factor 2 family protein [Flavobacteriaceae bacterium]